MNKSLLMFGCTAFLLLLAAPLHAQSGCADSPENPTLVLALVGSAGGLFSAIRSRVKTQRTRSAR